MSSDNGNQNDMNRNRRGSITQAAFGNLFQRSNSTSAGTPVFPSAAMNPNADPNRRRLSITTLGISGSSPSSAGAFNNFRRGSMSTNSDSIDENAIDEDDGSVGGPSRTAPTTPFTRRMSFGAQAMRNLRTGPSGSPGSNGNATTASPSRPPSVARRSSMHVGSRPSVGDAASTAAAADRRRSSMLLGPVPQEQQASHATTPRALSDVFHAARPDQQGFNWSEQLRSRAESSVQGTRPSFSYPSGSALSSSPPRPGGVPTHDRAKSVSEMPPAQAPKPKQPETRQKPDHFQERILKGDFYMD